MGLSGAWFVWILFAVLFVLATGFSFLVVHSFRTRHETERPVWLIAVASVVLVFFALALIPVDIYVTSSAQTAPGVSRMEDEAAAVSVLYLFFYGSTVVFTFVVIPWTFFYLEEVDDDMTLFQRSVGACKYTAFLVLIMATLLILGALLRMDPRADNEERSPAMQDFVEAVFADYSEERASLRFTIGILFLFGYLPLIIYGAFGLSYIPLALIQGTRTALDAKVDVSTQLDLTKKEKKKLLAKYVSGRQVTKKDQRILDDLEASERLLVQQKDHLGRNSSSCLAKLALLCRPFKMYFGIFFGFVTLWLTVALLVSNIDRTSNHISGFVSEKTVLFNICDELLRSASKAFPCDYILFSFVAFYYFSSLVAGMSKLGLRFLWIHVYSIRLSETAPQGMLAMCAILGLSMLSLHVQLLTLAPVYVSYGTQVFLNNVTNSLDHCTNEAPRGQCRLTQVAKFVSAVSLEVPAFGSCYYFLNWSFVATSIVSAVFVCAYNRRLRWNPESMSDSD